MSLSTDSSLQSTNKLAVDPSSFSMEPSSSDSSKKASHSHDQAESRRSHSSSSSDVDEYYFPDVAEDLKPKLNFVFETLTEAENFYVIYAKEAGFDANHSTIKRYAGKKDADISVKYMICSRSGFSQCVNHDSTKDNGGKQIRKTSSKKKGCPAIIKFKRASRFSLKFFVYKFFEQHNHKMVGKENHHLLHVNRQLDIFEQTIIHSLGSYNIGSCKAYTLLSIFKGGYDVNGGTETDYKNFKKDLNVSVGGNDAHMILQRMKERVECVPNFFFYSQIENGILTSMFWADEASKLNFQEFGDIVSFDATYDTNKYTMIFVPFTGVDNHRRCVTFGAGLLSNESTESYVWLLRTFLKAFGSQPKMIVTDQDAAMKIAVETVLTNSRHRLCMWHINKKLSVKTPYKVFSHPDFKKTFHKVVWNSLIFPEEFDSSWNSMIQHFDLKGEDWFKKLFDMRSSWIPSYLRDFPLSSLMRTTSRSECENFVFSKYLHPESNFLDFMSSFENTMEKQRHNQSLCDHQSSTTSPKYTTSLAIERFAADVYTRTIFFLVQKEIFNSVYNCFHFSVNLENDVEIYLVKEKKKNMWKEVIEKEVVVDEDPFAVYKKPFVDICVPTEHKVVYDPSEDSFTCTCMQLIQEGFLCRHIFYVLNIKGIEIIPSKYILRRWRKDIISTEVLRKRFSNIGEESKLVKDALSLFIRIVNKFGHEEGGLKNFISKLEEVHNELHDCVPSKPSTFSKESRMASLRGSSLPETVEVQNPQDVANKGTGKRLISDRDKSIAKRRPRECTLCHKAGHDARTCILNPKNQD